MRADKSIREVTKLGDVVEAAYELGRAVAADPATAATLATRRLERVLVRAGNLRLQAALALLANEVRPASRPTSYSPYASALSVR